MSRFFYEILSKYQHGFRKCFNSQHCLASISRGCFGALLLTDLSKAFDCLLHDLLIAKLHTYGFEKKSLKFIHSYLNDHKQRVKINNQHSSFVEIFLVFRKALY